jgi:macrolide transport system ATP-binding/permease protein
MKFLRRIQYLFNRRKLDRDLADEMAAHREMLAADRRTSFGSALKLREESHDAWGFTWLDQLQQDLRYGGRQLRRSPGFTLTAIAVLSLGVGLNLAVFQIVEAVFYNRISVRDSASLQRVVRETPARKLYAFPSGVANFYRENATQFSYLVTEQFSPVPLSLDDDPANVRAQFVSPNYFTALGVTPLHGRILDSNDDARENPAVVLGFGYWQRRFGSDPGVLGRIVYVNRKPVRVVGVTPAEFDGMSRGRADLWLPAGLRAFLTESQDPLEEYRIAGTTLFGVLKPGVSMAAASTEIRALAAQMREQHPEAFEDTESVGIQPLGDDEKRFGSFVFLIALVLLLLFSSSANLGNMILARGVARAREIETRIAMGAGRWRVIRQLMTENLLLAALSSVAALAIGRIGVQWFGLMGMGMPSSIRITTGWGDIVAVATLAIFSTLLFGLTPALGASRGGPQQTRARRALLVVQVAVSCLLLICSGLLSRGEKRLTASGSRLDFGSVVMVDPGLESANLSASAARTSLNGISQRLAQLPGVAGVTIAGGTPLFGVRIQNTRDLPAIFWQSVEPSYFRLMQVPLLQGRNFLPGERAGNIIVSESAARFRWPNEDPLGKSWGKDDAGPIVVGIVADSEDTAFRNPSAIEAYTPLKDKEAASAVIVVRVTGDPRPQLQNIRIASKLPGLTPSTWLLQSEVDQWIEHSGKATGMISALGSVGSLLAGVGMFGLIAFAVTQRTREIALRLALGARPVEILGALFAQYARPLAFGAAVGIVLAFGFMRVMSSQIILGVIAFDVPGYVMGLGAFLLIILAAVLIPARRALRIDPASALRVE